MHRHFAFILSLALVAPAASAEGLSSADSHPADRAAELQQLTQGQVASFLAGKNARATYRADLVGPHMLLGLSLTTTGTTPREQAESFVAEHASLFGVSADELRFSKESLAGRRRVVFFEQMHEGKRVHQRGLNVTLDAEGRVVRVVNETFPVIALARAAGKQANRRVDARRIALANFGPEAQATAAKHAREVIVASAQGAYEAVVVEVAPNPSQGLSVIEVVVDLHQGKVRGQRSAVLHYAPTTNHHAGHAPRGQR